MALVNNTPYAAIKRALVVQGDAIMGEDKTRWANTAFPKLVKPYATLEIQQLGRDLGVDQHDVVNNSGVMETTYTGLREMVVRATVYGDPPTTLDGIWPVELLQSLIASFQVESVLADFRVVPLAYMTSTPIVSEDAFDGDRWEWAAASDLTFNYRSIMFDDGLSTTPDDGVFIESTEIEINDEGVFTTHTSAGIYSTDYTDDYL